MSLLSWDRYIQLALATYSIAVAAFVGAWKVPGGVMTWQGAALLVISTASLFAALTLTAMAAFRHSGDRLGARLRCWRARRKRERKQKYYLMSRGQHSREEEGGRKYYSEGDVIGLSEEEVEKYGKDRMEGPIDIKAWRRLNKGKREGADQPR